MRYFNQVTSQDYKSWFLENEYQLFLTYMSTALGRKTVNHHFVFAPPNIERFLNQIDS